MSQWSSYGKPDPLVPFVEGRLDSLASVLKAGSNDSLDLVGRMARFTAPKGRLAWSGLAADAFFETIGDMPEDLAKLIQSYGAGYTAVIRYSKELRRLRSDSDAHLEVINSYEQRITSLRFQLAGVPIEDEAQRRDLERDIDSYTDSRNDAVRHADIILRDLDDAAARFKDEMWYAQDLGIHNRSWYVRFYADHVEIWVESFVGAWETLGPWVEVLGYALLVPPLTPLGFAVLKVHKLISFASLTLQSVDILLSDDDVDFGFAIDVGMTAIGIGAGKTASAYGTVSKIGRFASEVEAVVDAVQLGDSVLAIMDQVDSQLPAATEQFEDTLWTVGRPGLSQFVTTPTLIELEVDPAIRSDL